MPFIVIQEHTKESYTTCVCRDMREVRAKAKAKLTIRSEEIRRDEVWQKFETLSQMLEWGESRTEQGVYVGTLHEGGAWLMRACNVMPFRVPMGRNG